MLKRILIIIFCESALIWLSGCLPSANSAGQIPYVRKLSFSAGGAAVGPRWDPSAKRIYVNVYDSHYAQKLYVYDTVTYSTSLVYDGGGVVGMDWTKDGKFITAHVDLDGKDGIWNINPSAMNLRPSFLTVGDEASWSPDGGHLAVLWHDRSAATAYETETLEIHSAQGQEPEVIYRVSGSSVMADGLSWSPDGRSIAFSLSTGQEGLTVYRYDLSRKEAEVVAKGGEN